MMCGSSRSSQNQNDDGQHQQRNDLLHPLKLLTFAAASMQSPFEHSNHFRVIPPEH